MNNRDMFYNTYGFGEIPPFNNTNPAMNQIPNNAYNQPQFNDLNERVNRLERQIKRLEQRLTRLETPYINNNEPDNNMYMM